MGKISLSHQITHKLDVQMAFVKGTSFELQHSLTLILINYFRRLKSITFSANPLTPYQRITFQVGHESEPFETSTNPPQTQVGANQSPSKKTKKATWNGGLRSKLISIPENPYSNRIIFYQKNTYSRPDIKESNHFDHN